MTRTMARVPNVEADPGLDYLVTVRQDNLPPGPARFVAVLGDCPACHEEAVGSIHYIPTGSVGLLCPETGDFWFPLADGDEWHRLGYICYKDYRHVGRQIMQLPAEAMLELGYGAREFSRLDSQANLKWWVLDDEGDGYFIEESEEDDEDGY